MRDDDINQMDMRITREWINRTTKLIVEVESKSYNESLGVPSGRPKHNSRSVLKLFNCEVPECQHYIFYQPGYVFINGDDPIIMLSSIG
jgi:hypothetical protein